MKITEIYKKYKINEGTSYHHFRVAAVGVLISDNLSTDLNRKAIVSALLLHDLGNIIKERFDVFPEMIEPEGVEYWQSVKDEFISKYGPDEHLATVEICMELGVDAEILGLVDNIGFKFARKVLNSGDMAKMICCYSDQRVMPYSIGSLSERFEEGKKRYAGIYEDDGTFKLNTSALYEIEKLIFKNCSIKPEDINDISIAKIIEELKNYEI